MLNFVYSFSILKLTHISILRRFFPNTLASTQRLFLVVMQSPSILFCTHIHMYYVLIYKITYQTRSLSNCAYVVFSTTLLISVIYKSASKADTVIYIYLPFYNIHN